MRNLIVGALALLLGGCSTVWYRDGMTEQQFYQDDFECMQAATAYGGTTGYGTIYRGVLVGGTNPRPNRNLYNSCMRGRGYTTER